MKRKLDLGIMLCRSTQSLWPPSWKTDRPQFNLCAQRVTDLSAKIDVSFNNGRIFKKQTAKESLKIWLFIKVAFKMQFNSTR